MLKPWDERGPGEDASSIVNAVRGKLLSLPAGIALSFDPPSIPGLGATGGFEFQLEDLSGRGPEALSQITQALLAEARKQPELNPHALFSTFSTSTPQYDYQLDRTKAKLMGLDLPDIFQTLQIFFGSLYVNDFNQFGRTFRVTMQAEQDSRADRRRHHAALCPQQRGRHGAALNSRHVEADGRAGVHLALQRLWLCADQRRPGSWLQLQPGDRGDAAGRGIGAAGRLRL